MSAQTYETNLYPPLLEILNQDYSEINFSKNIFILTDGYIKDNDKCINLIKNNLNGFRIHSIGLGNDVDKIFIEQCAKLGKGSSSFIKGIKDVNSVVINALSKASRPYITNIKFEFENYKNEIASSIIKCNPINNFAYQNEVMNYSFILPGNKEIKDLKIRLTGKDPINQIEIRNTLEKMIKLENGDEMNKMIVGIALKNNENLISKDEKKEINIAKKYQILSKNTQLFAEILKGKNQRPKLIKVDLIFNLNGNQLYINISILSKEPLDLTNQKKFKEMFNMPPTFTTTNIIMNPIINQMMNQIMNMDMVNNQQMNSYNPMVNWQPMNGNNPMIIPTMFPVCPIIGVPPPHIQKRIQEEKEKIMQIQLEEKMHEYLMKNNLPSHRDYQELHKNIFFNTFETKKPFDFDLIMHQDVWEGYWWYENSETKIIIEKIIDIISLDKSDKIKNKIIALKKGKKENDIFILY